ncbi:transposase [Pseudomonas khavaziana]|uniref:transposase n=1 Tax=Pseudomonas khavaziana TaxID=2842351 RepID=UPI001CECA724|nr:transposase [Pseudomonas khavaziana]
MRKSYSSEFKLKAASMVLDEGQPVTEVCASLDIGPTALRRWIDQVQKERLGSTPVGAKAITADQREIQRLKALLREKDLISKSRKGQCSPALTPKIIHADR